MKSLCQRTRAALSDNEGIGNFLFADLMPTYINKQALALFC
jgi:hypothetical protein